MCSTRSRGGVRSRATVRVCSVRGSLPSHCSRLLTFRSTMHLLYPVRALCTLRATTTALIYNGFNSTLDSYRGGKHDIYGSMFAGACTGVVWRCTGAFCPSLSLCSRHTRLTDPTDRRDSRRQAHDHHFGSAHCRSGGVDDGQDRVPLRWLKGSSEQLAAEEGGGGIEDSGFCACTILVAGEVRRETEAGG